MSHEQILALDSQIKGRLANCKRLVDAASRDGRKLEEWEKRDLDRDLLQIEELKREKDSVRESTRMADDVRSRTGSGSDGLRKVVSAFCRGEKIVSVPGVDLLSKGVTFADAENRQMVASGITELVEDKRRLSSLFSSKDPGPALTVAEFKQTGSRVITGTVERALTAATAKATMDVTVSYVEASVRQLAVLIKDIPNALFDAEPALNGFLASQLQVALDVALDAHVAAQINAAGVPWSLDTGVPLTDVRTGKTTMEARGAHPAIVAVPGSVAQAIDLQTDATRALGYPFSLRWVVVPQLTDLLMIDPAGAQLYVGNARLERDPYTSFDKNLSNVRAELSALFHVRQASLFQNIGGGSILT